jgi:hypothetical protein
VRQGSIVGDGDKVFPDRDSARTHYLHLLDLLGKCDMEIACETPEESFAAITPMLRPETRVEELNPPPKAKKHLALVAVVALIIAAALGSRYLLEQRQALRLQAARWELNARNAARRAHLQANPEEFFPRPSRKIFLEDCLRDMNGLPVAVQGWELAEAVCDPASLSVSFRHGPGASFQSLPPDAKLLDTTLAEAEYPRPTTSAAVPIPLILPRDEAMRHLYQLTQDAGLILRTAWQPRKTRKFDEETVIQSPWLEGKLEFDVPESVLFSQLAGLLEIAPGMSLSSVEMKKMSVWTIKGVLYVR